LGDASYAIYLVHFLVISAIGKARAVLDWQLGPYWAAEFAAVVLIATAFGVAVHVAIERPLLERLRRLSGTSKRCAAGAAPSIRAGGVAV
jgi:peptidoglycan/LPS O-acetylase OafA/YrhL